MMMRKTALFILLAAVLICPAAPAQTSELDGLLAKVAKWDYHDARDPLFAVSDVVLKAHGSVAETRQIETRFIAFLKGEATPAGKDFICRQLSLMGSDASVPQLSGMLLKADTAEIARFALERIPGPAVDRALRAGLAKTTGKTRIGIINTLGVRRDAASVALLRPLALGSDAATAGAAWHALAAIADPAAVKVLDAAVAKNNQATTAYLKAASALAARGNAAAALPIYKKVYAGGPAPMRAAALQGIASAGGAQSATVLAQALNDSDVRVQAIAIDHLPPAQLVAEIPKLNETGQVRALGTLAYKGDSSTQQAFLTALKSSSKPVRLAAINGIGSIGSAAALAPLAEIAANGDDAEQTAARTSLGRLRGKEVDEAIVQGIPSADGKVKLELIRAAGDRGTVAAGPILLKMATSGSDDVRRESLRALRDTGSSSDIAALVALVVKPGQADDRTEAGRSLAGVLRRSDPSRIADVISAYGPASDVEAKIALMQVMRQSGNPQALSVLRGGLKEENAELKRGAILALAEWPDPTPIPDLMETARTASNPVHQVLALRSALQLIRLPAAGRSPAETAKLLATAMSLAKQADEKRTVLTLLQRFPSKEALDLATAYVNDSEVSAEAKAAVTRLERAVRR